MHSRISAARFVAFLSCLCQVSGEEAQQLLRNAKSRSVEVAPTGKAVAHPGALATNRRNTTNSSLPPDSQETQAMAHSPPIDHFEEEYASDNEKMNRFVDDEHQTTLSTTFFHLPVIVKGAVVPPQEVHENLVLYYAGICGGEQNDSQLLAVEQGAKNGTWCEACWQDRPDAFGSGSCMMSTYNQYKCEGLHGEKRPEYIWCPHVMDIVRGKREAELRAAQGVSTVTGTTTMPGIPGYEEMNFARHVVKNGQTVHCYVDPDGVGQVHEMIKECADWNYALCNGVACSPIYGCRKEAMKVEGFVYRRLKAFESAYPAYEVDPAGVVPDWVAPVQYTIHDAERFCNSLSQKNHMCRGFSCYNITGMYVCSLLAESIPVEERYEKVIVSTKNTPTAVETAENENFMDACFLEIHNEYHVGETEIGPPQVNNQHPYLNDLPGTPVKVGVEWNTSYNKDTSGNANYTPPIEAYPTESPSDMVNNILGGNDTHGNNSAASGGNGTHGNNSTASATSNATEPAEEHESATSGEPAEEHATSGNATSGNATSGNASVVDQAALDSVETMNMDPYSPRDPSETLQTRRIKDHIRSLGIDPDAGLELEPDEMNQSPMY